MSPLTVKWNNIATDGQVEQCPSIDDQVGQTPANIATDGQVEQYRH
jgi:hypothetical protein